MTTPLGPNYSNIDVVMIGKKKGGEYVSGMENVRNSTNETQTRSDHS
jgi:hypothetical protein